MNDSDLRQNVIDELEFDPSFEASSIGVAAKNGIVTLTGHVSSYAEKQAAERAARRVKGVMGLAQEIEIRYPTDKKTSDDEIARRCVNIIAWDTTLPEGKISVKAERGWVTLTGEVPWHYQRVAAEFWRQKNLRRHRHHQSDHDPAEGAGHRRQAQDRGGVETQCRDRGAGHPRHRHGYERSPRRQGECLARARRC